MRGFAHAESDIGTADLGARWHGNNLSPVRTPIWLATSISIPSLYLLATKRQTDRNGDGELITIGLPTMTPPSSLSGLDMEDILGYQFWRLGYRSGRWMSSGIGVGLLAALTSTESKTSSS